MGRWWLALWLFGQASDLWAYTANKVWFEFMEDGRYRVSVNYTIPALKEFRESYVIFARRADAEKFYWSLLQGADFYPESPAKTKFNTPKLQPQPW